MFDVRSLKLTRNSLVESNLERRTLNVSELSSVGRVGELVLDYAREGDRTILTHSRCRAPWNCIPPIQLDDSACLYTPLVNPSGGLVGGDRLSVRAALGSEAHVLFSTPSANRVYRSLGETAVQAVELHVGSGAILEWVPDVTIPFAGSRFKQTIHVTLAPGATVLLWDAIASGRVARGERWAFASLENEIRITTASGQCVLERYALDAQGIGMAARWDYAGSLYLIGDGVEAGRWKQVEDRLADILDRRVGTVLGGVSQPAAPGLAVKLLARSAPELNGTLDELWQAIRLSLWNLPRPSLRRY
ncbi:MAG: urease accessory protein UreD [Nitrospira sp.]|nr:urease accessory protein UreD [Nitrospira sp.]